MNLTGGPRPSSEAREALVLAEQAGTPRLATTRFALADLYYVFGQWDEALAELDPAVGLPGPFYLPLLVHGLIALIAAHRQDWQTADDHLSDMPDRSGMRTSTWPTTSTTCCWRARCSRSEQGGYDQVTAILSVALDPEIAPEMPGRYILLSPLARAAFEQADEATLAAVAAAAQQEAEKAGLPVRDAVADHCRGLMTGDPGLVLAAADYFGAAGRATRPRLRTRERRRARRPSRRSDRG